jgi:uncharacterized cupredoxin-like copper-binding protein
MINRKLRNFRCIFVYPGDPGSSGEFEVGDIALGEYEVVCTIPGHAEKGMKGTLTVK